MTYLNAALRLGYSILMQAHKIVYALLFVLFFLFAVLLRAPGSPEMTVSILSRVVGTLGTWLELEFWLSDLRKVLSQTHLSLCACFFLKMFTKIFHEGFRVELELKHAKMLNHFKDNCGTIISPRYLKCI